MKLEEFRETLDAKGADLSAWPEGERRAAETLLAASAEARQALQQALALDALLSETLAPAAAPAGLRDAILAEVAANPRAADDRSFRLGGLRWFWRAGLGTACAMGLAGFLLGFTGAIQPPGAATDDVNIVSLVYGPSAGAPSAGGSAPGGPRP